MVHVLVTGAVVCAAAVTGHEHGAAIIGPLGPQDDPALFHHSIWRSRVLLLLLLPTTWTSGSLSIAGRHPVQFTAACRRRKLWMTPAFALRMPPPLCRCRHLAAAAVVGLVLVPVLGGVQHAGIVVCEQLLQLADVADG